MKIKTCATCGKKFPTRVLITRNEGKPYCSDECFANDKGGE